MNPVISRKYVEENYIKKDELKKFIEYEIKTIDKCKKERKNLARSLEMDGMKAAYVAIKNIFLEGKYATDSIYNTRETSRESKT